MSFEFREILKKDGFAPAGSIARKHRGFFSLTCRKRHPPPLGEEQKVRRIRSLYEFDAPFCCITGCREEHDNQPCGGDGDDTSSVIRFAGDGGCHSRLAGRRKKRTAFLCHRQRQYTFLLKEKAWGGGRRARTPHPTRPSRGIGPSHLLLKEKA